MVIYYYNYLILIGTDYAIRKHISTYKLHRSIVNKYTNNTINIDLRSDWMIRHLEFRLNDLLLIFYVDNTLQ